MSSLVKKSITPRSLGVQVVSYRKHNNKHSTPISLKILTWCFKTSAYRFSRDWLHNGCLHFLLALIALKLMEGYTMIGNFALQGKRNMHSSMIEYAHLDLNQTFPADNSPADHAPHPSHGTNSPARSPTSSASIWSDQDDLPSPLVSDVVRVESCYILSV